MVVLEALERLERTILYLKMRIGKVYKTKISFIYTKFTKDFSPIWIYETIGKCTGTVFSSVIKIQFLNVKKKYVYVYMLNFSK